MSHTRKRQPTVTGTIAMVTSGSLPPCTPTFELITTFGIVALSLDFCVPPSTWSTDGLRLLQYMQVDLFVQSLTIWSIQSIHNRTPSVSVLEVCCHMAANSFSCTTPWDAYHCSYWVSARPNFYWASLAKRCHFFNQIHVFSCIM